MVYAASIADNRYLKVFNKSGEHTDLGTHEGPELHQQEMSTEPLSQERSVN